MLYILIALFISLAASYVLVQHGENGYKLRHAVSGAFGIFGFMVTGITAIVYAFTIWSWFAAEHKANIINREYNTNYTQEEIFYADSVIETVRQLDRKRYEVNGNLLNQAK